MSTLNIRRRSFRDSSPDHGNIAPAPPRRGLNDPFCIVVWKFRVDAANVEAFSALCQKSGELVSEQAKCLFQRVTRKGEEFKVHLGLEDSFGVLTHVVGFSETLRQARRLATFKGLEIHGPGTELAQLRQPLQAFDPAFFERSGDRLV